MAFKILFITSHYFHPLTEAALKRITPECETKVVAYDDFQHISHLYDQHTDWFDACLVSGEIARRVIEQTHDALSKPLIHFQVSINGLHRDILRFAVKQQSLDFSRIALDFLIPLDTGYSIADYLSYDDPSGLVPQTFQNLSRLQVDYTTLEPYLLSRIQQLYSQNRIDLVFCQYSSLVPELGRMGIPCHCPFLSDDHLRQIIEEVLVRLELRKMQNNHPAIIQVFPRQNQPLRSDQHRLMLKSLQQFIQGNMIDCVVQNSPNCITLISTFQVLQYLTNGFQDCRISAFLNEMLDFPIAVGYGIGTTVSHAMNNVQLASQEAKVTGSSFLMDGSGNLIGPLNAASPMVLHPRHQTDLSHIARQCSLSSMTIKKILSIIHATGSDKMTIPDLAARMGTTVRNANRIMLNLCKGNVATPVYTQASHSRGRPLQVYALNFDLAQK